MKQRREKDIINNATESWTDAVTQYQDYFEGSPISITYYRISDEASRTDSSLEDTHEVVGNESSLFYHGIKHLDARGTTPFDILTQLTQRGIESFITGDFVLTPDTNIYPRAGEFFKYEDSSNPEIEAHLFQITDVQYDRPTSQKYFKCSFKLYPKNAADILNHVIKWYVYDPNGAGNTDGVGNGALITEEDAALKTNVENLRDALIDTFTDLFYNASMDTFTYQKSLDAYGEEFEYYWSPYICHFIYKNKLLEKTNSDFLTEIYVEDYSESNYPGIYNEQAYRESIFHALEVDDPKTIKPIEGSFIEVSAYDLNKPLSLPFFSSAEEYKLLEHSHDHNMDFWLGAFNWIYDDEDKLFCEKDGDFKYTGDLTEYLISRRYISATGEVVKPEMIFGKQYYKKENATDLVPTEIWTFHEDPDVVGVDILYNADLYAMLNNTSTVIEEKNYLIGIIRSYFNNSLVLNSTTLTKLNNYYYSNSLKTYVLLPIIIYILQNCTRYTE